MWMRGWWALALTLPALAGSLPGCGAPAGAAGQEVAVATPLQARPVAADSQPGARDALLKAGQASAPLSVAAEPQPGGGRELAAGQLSDLTEERTEVVQTAAAWEALWRLHDPGRSPPALDFTLEQVAFVVLQRTTGGYQLGFSGVRVGPDATTVELVEDAPGPLDLTTQALTQPWIAVALPRSPLPVRVTVTRRVGGLRPAAGRVP